MNYCDDHKSNNYLHQFTNRNFLMQFRNRKFEFFFSFSFAFKIYIRPSIRHGFEVVIKIVKNEIKVQITKRDH